MSLNNSLEIIDRTGWRMVVALDKPIVYIGSNPGRDVVLDPARGSGVSPMHAQMIFAAHVAGCRLVNLGSTEIAAGERPLAPLEVTHIPGETSIKIGDFCLVLHAGAESTLDLPSVGDNIAISVSLPFTRLEPGRSLNGSLRVRNQGDQGSVQVDLEIAGLDPACYVIEPGPVLAQGTEKAVAFRIYHRGSQPPAGLHPITFRAMATNAYAGEEVSLTHSIQVLPAYDFEMELLPPGAERPSLQQPAVQRLPSLPGRTDPTRPTPSTRARESALSMPAPLPVSAPFASSSRKSHPYQEIWEAAQTEPEETSPAEPEPSAPSAPEPTPSPAPVPAPDPAPAVAAAAPAAPAAAPRPAAGGRPHLGLQGITLTPSLVQAMNLPAGQRGVMIILVTPGGPADRAGLQAGEQSALVDGYRFNIGGDVLTSWDGQPLNSMEDLQNLLAQAAPEQTIKLAHLRNGQPRQARLKLGLPIGQAAPTIIPLRPQAGPSTPPPARAGGPAESSHAAQAAVLGSPSAPAPKKTTTARRKSEPAAKKKSRPPSADNLTPAPPAPSVPAPAVPAAATPAPPGQAQPASEPAQPAALPASAPRPIDAPTSQPPPEPAPGAAAAPPAQPAPHKAVEPPPTDDWWSPVSPAAKIASPAALTGPPVPVVKMKAGAATPSRPASPTEPASGPQKPAAPAEDTWWGPDVQNVGPSTEVIQLKARPEANDESQKEKEA